MEEFSHNPDLLPAPVGQPNLGATCWFNALTQALKSVTGLTSMVTRGVQSPPLPVPYLARAYAKYCTGGPVGDFLNVFMDVAKKHGIAANTQNCTHEAYTHFISELGIPAADAACKMTIIYSSKCLCGKEKEWTDYAYYVGVIMKYLPPTADNLTKYILARYAPFDWVCDCSRKINTRIERLAHVGNVVVMTFFQYHVRRAYDFPLRLELPKGEGGVHVFILVAQIEHFGTPFSGHYVARCLRKDGDAIRVYRFDDMNVSLSHFEPTVNTYMLIYERSK